MIHKEPLTNVSGGSASQQEARVAEQLLQLLQQEHTHSDRQGRKMIRRNSRFTPKGSCSVVSGPAAAYLIPAHRPNVLHCEVPLVGFVGVPGSVQPDTDTESYLRHHVIIDAAGVWSARD